MNTGYYSTIFVYGQTGTGKTHTISGDPTNPDQMGIIPRAFKYILDRIKSDDQHIYKLALNYVQIYMEVVRLI